jgi:hypothetical protein
MNHSNFAARGEHQPPSKKPQALARCGSPGYKN